MRRSWAIASLLVFASGCEQSPTSSVDGGGADVADEAGDVGRDAPTREEGGSGDAGEDAGPVAGPLTVVADTVEVDVERMCDLDGDGSLDNAIADLGMPSSALLAAALTSVLQGRVDERIRMAMHLPWIDDLRAPRDPEVVAVLFRGEDEDGDPGDDFSGTEPFLIPGSYLDACGEPLTYFPGSIGEGGSLEAASEGSPFPLAELVEVEGGAIEGTIEPLGVGFDIRLCGYASIRSLGASTEVPGIADLTLLEAFVTGGPAFGVASVPGVTPDVDVDGDGFERFETDSSGRIVSCLDGDLTPIAGSDCWTDPRMADGFSLVVRLEGVPAAFAGREHNWEASTEGSCVDPPERSIFDRR